jgi:hypothetical protein
MQRKIKEILQSGNLYEKVEHQRSISLYLTPNGTSWMIKRKSSTEMACLKDRAEPQQDTEPLQPRTRFSLDYPTCQSNTLATELMAVM